MGSDNEFSHGQGRGIPYLYRQINDASPQIESEPQAKFGY